MAEYKTRNFVVDGYFIEDVPTTSEVSLKARGLSRRPSDYVSNTHPHSIANRYGAVLG